MLFIPNYIIKKVKNNPKLRFDFFKTIYSKNNNYWGIINNKQVKKAFYNAGLK